MGIISHNDAITLELIVRTVYNCERFDIMNIANADTLEYNPISAVLVVFAPLYKYGQKNEQIDEFADIYSSLFDGSNKIGQKTFDTFIDIFKYLINTYVDKNFYDNKARKIHTIIEEKNFNNISALKEYLENNNY